MIRMQEPPEFDDFPGCDDRCPPDCPICGDEPPADAPDPRDLPRFVDIDCPTCQGDGRVYMGRYDDSCSGICDECRGQGFVPVETFPLTLEDLEEISQCATP